MQFATIKPINIRFEICVPNNFIINITPEFVKLDITELLFGSRSENNILHGYVQANILHV